MSTEPNDSPIDHSKLTAAQAAGLACVHCGREYLAAPVARVAVGRSVTDSQVFACLHSDGTACGGLESITAPPHVAESRHVGPDPIPEFTRAQLAHEPVETAIAVRTALAGLDEGSLAALERMLGHVHARGYGDAQRDMDEQDRIEAVNCPQWCQTHVDDPKTGERTHLGSRTMVGPFEVQMSETRRLADAQTVDSRVFVGPGTESLTIDEARRLARLLWERARELGETSTQFDPGDIEAETVEADRYRQAFKYGMWCARTAYGLALPKTTQD